MQCDTVFDWLTWKYLVGSSWKSRVILVSIIPVSQMLCRLVVLTSKGYTTPLNQSAVSRLPLLSFLLPAWRGWWISPMKWTTYFRLSLRGMRVEEASASWVV